MLTHIGITRYSIHHKHKCTIFSTNKNKKRIVCVNQKAIKFNLLHNTNYPTSVVIEDDVIFEFHYVNITTGTLQFDPTKEVKVFIETEEPIYGFIDPNTPDQSFLNRIPSVPLGIAIIRKIKQFVWNVWRKTPIISCLMDKDIPNV